MLTRRGKSCVVEDGTHLQNVFCKPCKSEKGKIVSLIEIFVLGQTNIVGCAFKAIKVGFKIEMKNVYGKIYELCSDIALRYF